MVGCFLSPKAEIQWLTKECYYCAPILYFEVAERRHNSSIEPHFSPSLRQYNGWPKSATLLCPTPVVERRENSSIKPYFSSC